MLLRHPPVVPRIATLVGLLLGEGRADAALLGVLLLDAYYGAATIN